MYTHISKIACRICITAWYKSQPTLDAGIKLTIGQPGENTGELLTLDILMALSNEDVITMQPATIGQLQYDINGEPIVFEGVCWNDGLKNDIKLYYRNYGLAICAGLGLPCTLPIGAYCAKRACENWRLYLTDKHIHYETTVIVPTSPNCCSSSFRKIPLTDIEDIQAATGLIRAGFCGLGVKLSCPTTIQIEMKGIPLCGCCCKVPVVVQLSNCDNAAEFAEAVKRQLNVICRE